MRRAMAVFLMSAGLTGIPVWTAAAHAATACVIRITQMSWNPPVVAPGQLAMANATARNCTAQTQPASVMWREQFTSGTGTGGIPPGCPAIDPLPPQPVTFAPYASYTATSGGLIPTGCTATELQATVTFFAPNGTVLAQHTADLHITQPTT
jgi:hypothetical protein